MNHHPEGVQPLTDQLLALFLRVSDVVHDVADDVVVEGKGGLDFVLRKKKHIWWRVSGIYTNLNLFWWFDLRLELISDNNQYELVKNGT